MIKFCQLPFFLCLPLAGVWAQSEEIQLFYGQNVHSIRMLPYTKPPFVHLDDFFTGVGVRAEKDTSGKITLEINRRTLTVDTARSTAYYGQRQVPFPLRRKHGLLYGRVDTLVSIFSYLFGRTMIYEPTSKSLHLPKSEALHIKTRTRQVRDSYRIILNYSQNLDKPDVKKAGKKVIVKLKEAVITLDRTGFEPNEAVSSMSVFEALPDGTTEIVFDLTQKTSNCTVERFNPNNPRTVLKLSGNFLPPETEQSAVAGTTHGIRKIAVDPGHGGIDKGAVGPSGLQEKEVTLGLARMLKDYLEEHTDYEVMITRRDDEYLSPKARTGKANHFEADLFLSIHVNAIRAPNATGSETYYLSMDAAQEDLDPHYREFEENDNGEGDQVPEDLGDDLSLMLWDLAQTKHIEDSFRIAKYIQQSMNLMSGIKSRGVKQLPLKVLRGATMPAVLLEVAFISNPQEETKLKTVAFREQIVAAIGRAVTQYDEDVKKREQSLPQEPTEEGR